MNNGAGGAVPIVTILDYLNPEVNRPDLYFQQAYSVQGGSGNTRSLQRHKADTSERSPYVSLYYTIGLVVVSAAIFLTIAAWSNVLLSWYDSMFVSPLIANVTQSRLFFAITLTAIAIVVVVTLIVLWYYFTIDQQK